MTTRLALWLALVVTTCGPWACRAAEPTGSGPDAAVAKEESLRRSDLLDSAYSDFLKTPSPQRRKAFLQAAHDCLWDQSQEVSGKAVALLKAWPDYFSRRVLSDFVHECGRLSKDGQDAHRKAVWEATLVLLSIDLRGRFEFHGELDVQYFPRTSDEKADFLRATYWAHHNDGAEIVEWILMNLAVLDQPLAREVLASFQDDLKAKAKASEGSVLWCTTIPRLKTRVAEFQDKLVQAKSLPAAISSSLREATSLDDAYFILGLLSKAEVDLELQRQAAILEECAQFHKEKADAGKDGGALSPGDHRMVAEALKNHCVLLRRRLQRAHVGTKAVKEAPDVPTGDTKGAKS